MAKTIEQNFIDWESETFGFGYGTGEYRILPALKNFFSLIGVDPDRPRGYWFVDLEKEMPPAVVWFLINILCHVDLIEYGTSPRGGWLTEKGVALKAFIDGKTVDELIELACAYDKNRTGCMSDYCNCDPPTRGKPERGCANPFWFDTSELSDKQYNVALEEAAEIVIECGHISSDLAAQRIRAKKII